MKPRKIIRGEEMQRVGIISCVGTSILFHYSKWLNRSIQESLDYIEGEEVEDYLLSIHQDLMYHELKYPSAELQTLALFFKEYPALKPAIKDITLFPTETTNGEAAAHLLCKIFTNQKIGETIFQTAPHVSVEPFPLSLDEERSPSQITELVFRFREKAAYYRTQEYDRIVISISAGYKVVTPYLSLLAFLDGEEVIYCHQESRGIITLPQLPFHWDLRLLDEYRTWLVMDEIPSSVYDSLPHRFRSFYGSVPQKKDISSVFVKSAFGKMISNDYTEGRHLRYGWGETLLQEIKDHNLRDELTSIIQKRWEYIFLGDQIPETVEHTRGHSQRLMEMGRDLLNLTSLKMKDEEIFLFIASIWLHDIGHKSLTSKYLGQGEFPLYLYPSLVRRYHNILSAELIEELSEFNPSICREIAHLALYHRRAMPLLSQHTRYEDGLFSLSYGPLEEELKDLDFRGTIVEKENLLFLAALLRFLDACDVQADRVVSPYYREARSERTEHEIAVYLGRLRTLCTALNKNDPEEGEILRIIARVEEVALSPNGERDREGKRLGKIINQLVVRLFQEGKDGYLELLGLADSILFKLEQRHHMAKHAGIECVYLGEGSYSRSPSPINIYILSRGYPDEEKDSVFNRIKTVGSHIEEEYVAVKGVLQRSFILQDVYWNTGEELIKLYSGE